MFLQAHLYPWPIFPFRPTAIVWFYLSPRWIVLLSIDYFLVLMLLSIGSIPLAFMMVFLPELDDPSTLTFFTQILFVLFSFGYFVILERVTSTTIGKKLYSLEISEKSEPWITYKQALIRNLSKIRPELILIDLLIGYWMRPSRNQRALEIFSHTTVTESTPERKYTEREESTLEVFKIVLLMLGLITFLLMIVSTWVYPILMLFEKLVWCIYWWILWEIFIGL